MKRIIQVAGRLAWISVIFAAWWAASSPALAQPPEASVRQQVAAAVAGYLQLDTPVSLSESNLQVLASLSSLPTGIDFHVISVRAGFAPGRWLLRLGCASLRDCLPFAAVLRAPKLDPDLLYGSRAMTRKSLPVSGPAGPRQARSSLLTHSGDHVELVEELSGMRLRAPAICLQSGSLGERIRVRNLATHRVLLATVAGERSVRVEP